MGLRFVYMTAKNTEEAQRLGRMLVEEKLAACVNVVETAHSIYWWEGRMEEGREAVLIAKTRASLVPKLIERVKMLHSYECPCVITFPISEGNEEYLAWVEEEATGNA